MDRWKIGVYALALLLLSLVACNDAHAERDWALTLYSGRLTDADLAKAATFNFEFEDAYLIDLGLARRLYTFQNYFDIEIEGQIAKYFGDQDNWEFNLVAYFRWLLFPWERLFRHELRCRGGAILRHLCAGNEAKHYEDTAQFLGALDV